MVVTAVVTFLPYTATIVYVWTPTTRALDVFGHTITMDSVMMRITTRNVVGTVATAAPAPDTVASTGTVKNAGATIPLPTLMQRVAKGLAAQVNTRVTYTAMMITTTAAAAGTAVTVVAKLALRSNSSTVSNARVWMLVLRHPIALLRDSGAMASATMTTTSDLVTGTTATAAVTTKAPRISSTFAKSAKNIIVVNTIITGRICKTSGFF